MTYIRNGREEFDANDAKVFGAIKDLNEDRRTTNNSQIASATGLSRTMVGSVTNHLRARGFIKNVSKGAAYHWRLTGKKPGAPAARSVSRETPQVILAHFDRKLLPGDPRQPIVISDSFIPGKGWIVEDDLPVTYAEIRRLAAEGVDTIAVRGYGVVADFPIKPILDEASRPLLGGSLIGGTRRSAR